jgi:hypothetical protein
MLNMRRRRLLRLHGPGMKTVREVTACRFGYEEHDGDRYCFEHYGFHHYADPVRRCDIAKREVAAALREAAADE